MQAGQQGDTLGNPKLKTSNRFVHFRRTIINAERFLNPRSEFLLLIGNQRILVDTQRDTNLPSLGGDSILGC